MAAEENENMIREKEDDEKSPLLGVSGSDTECNEGWIACRYVVSLTGMIGLMIVYALRVNLSVAVVAMVNQSALAPSVHNYSEECPEDYNNQTAKSKDGSFVWNEAEQGVILGSFFWGYTATQVIGGILSARFGGKWLFGLGVAGTGALTLLTPVVAGLGPWYLVALRVLEGGLEGVTFPAMYQIISKWSPPLERTIMVALTFSGTQSGTVLSLPISGLLCQHGFDGGWPSVFYCFGTASLVWFVFYCVLVYEDPASHPRISQREKLYIQKIFREYCDKDERIPWGAILTSVPVWALTLGFMGYTWCFYTLLTCLPLYLKEILRFDIQENGFVSSLPYIVAAIVSILIGVILDKVRAQAWCSTACLRKTVNTVGLVMDGVLLIGVGLVGCDRWAAVALLILSSGFGAFVMGGMSINHIELSPRYAGIVMGITNTGAQIPGILAPIVVGYFTNGQPTHDSWMKVFYLGAGVTCAGALIFLFFGSCQIQTWNGSDSLAIDRDRPSIQTILSDSLTDAERLRTVTNHRSDDLIT